MGSTEVVSVSSANSSARASRSARARSDGFVGDQRVGVGRGEQIGGRLLGRRGRSPQFRPEPAQAHALQEREERLSAGATGAQRIEIGSEIEIGLDRDQLARQERGVAMRDAASRAWSA